MPLDRRTLNRRRAVETTPWTRAILGDTSGIELPDGYHIVTLATRPTGPVQLTLLRRGGHPIDRTVLAADAVRELGALVDIAYVDATRVVVTTDGAGYITDIRDGAA